MKKNIMRKDQIQIHKKYFLIILLANVAIISFFFLFSGFFAERSDTQYFVGQINSYRGIVDLSKMDGTMHDMVYFRGFKPLYGILGGYLLFFLSPKSVILILNLLFFFGLSFISYTLFLLLGFNKKLSVVGSIWISLSYPMLKYGLALVTDISGWFFLYLSIVVLIIGLKEQNYKKIFISSILCFIGSLTKETGSLGIIFGISYLCLSYKEWGIKETFKKLSIFALPAFILEIIFMFLMYKTGAPSFISWYKYNFAIYFHDFYKLRYFITNEFLALNGIYFISIFGILAFLKNKIGTGGVRFMLSTILPSIIIWFWPVFYYRIFFIQTILFIPLALWGIQYIAEKRKSFLSFSLENIFIIVPIIFNIILFISISKM